MTTQPEQTRPNHMPGHRFVAPAARPPHAAAPAPVHTAPVRAPAPAPAPVHTAPIRAAAPAPAPVQHHVAAPRPAAQPRPTYQAQPVAQYRAPVAQQRPVVVTNNYYSAAQPRRDYHHQQYPHRHQSQPSSGNFLTGLLAGGIFGNMLGRGMFGSGVRQAPYSSSYAPGFPDNQRAAAAQPMHPAKFESMMDAAVEGRPFTRIRGNNGEEVPTTPEDRQMFKQVMFNMLRRAGQPVDENAMFIPGIMYGPNRMHPSERGTHISHFSDDFRNPSLGNMVDRNYDMLRDQYASEYRQFQDYQRSQGASYRQPSGYQQQPYYQSSYQPRTTIANIRLF